MKPPTIATAIDCVWEKDGEYWCALLSSITVISVSPVPLNGRRYGKSTQAEQTQLGRNREMCGSRRLQKWIRSLCRNEVSVFPTAPGQSNELDAPFITNCNSLQAENFWPLTEAAVNLWLSTVHCSRWDGATPPMWVSSEGLIILEHTVISQQWRHQCTSAAKWHQIKEMPNFAVKQTNCSARFFFHLILFFIFVKSTFL